MTISTLFRYLLGNRDAILQIASCKQAVWLGLLLVLSAGFAREYDGEDLWHEPWHLLIPLAASLVTSFVLFCLIYAVQHSQRGLRGRFLELYPRFLGLYWMTAPLAWLYAIPVELFLSANDATLANLWLLAIVSFWRVWLIIRVISVLFNMSRVKAFFPVMLFAVSFALQLRIFIPVPFFVYMAGIRLSQSERIIQDTAFLVGALGILTWPIWCIGTIVVMTKRFKRGGFKPPVVKFQQSSPIAASLWALAAVAIVGWLPVLLLTQPVQQLRYRVERDLKSGRIAEGLAVMSAHQPEDFPPYWDPPPRIAFAQRSPPLIDVVEYLQSESAAPWVHDIFLDKFRNSLNGPDQPYGIWPFLDDRNLERYLAVIERLPDKAEIAEEQKYPLDCLLEGIPHIRVHQEWFGPLPDERELPATEPLRERIKSLLISTGHPLTAENSDNPEDVEPHPEATEMSEAMPQPAAPAESQGEH